MFQQKSATFWLTVFLQSAQNRRIDLAGSAVAEGGAGCFWGMGDGVFSGSWSRMPKRAFQSFFTGVCKSARFSAKFCSVSVEINLLTLLKVCRKFSSFKSWS
ncbi:MAG: hypothetical protein ACFN26_06300, partial [Kingella denitrificans]